MTIINNNTNIEKSTQSKSIFDNKRKEMDKDAFLQLLVTQLRNQDPLNPVEDKEFIAQMAQFSSLEQMQNLNSTMVSTQKQIVDQLSELAHISSSTISFQAFSLIGKEITALLENAKGDKETVVGVVTSVRVAGGFPIAYVGDKKIPIANIAEVREHKKSTAVEVVGDKVESEDEK